MIRDIPTMQALLRTPIRDYIVVEIDTITKGSFFGLVTNVETRCQDESDVVFHDKPFQVIISGDFVLEFTGVPEIIHLYVSAKEVMSNEVVDHDPFVNAVLSEQEWLNIFKQESSLSDEDLNPNSNEGDN